MSGKVEEVERAGWNALGIRWSREWTIFLTLLAAFLTLYWAPLEGLAVPVLSEALLLAQDYARQHVILCLVPAFFIAGAIGVFVSQASVVRYFGPGANKVLAYGVASVSGSVLAVCSCTVLPLFAGIYRMGAGLGPAVAFLYSGPAINVLAVILTARILGMKLGVARAFGAVLFSIVAGLVMHLIYRKEELRKAEAAATMPVPEAERPLWQNAVFFASLVGVLVFANWGKPGAEAGLWAAVHQAKWYITAVFAAGLGAMLVWLMGVRWWKVVVVGVIVLGLGFLVRTTPMPAFVAGVAGLAILTSRKGGEAGEWTQSTWGYAKQIVPLLLAGVLVAGALLGRPGHEGLIPNRWVQTAVGGNSLRANFFAAISGAFMYFATLTEVPILETLIGSGMGQGPALALLLAGPTLSLPSMLVLRSIMGTQKTVVYVLLVISMATISGLIFGALF